MGHSKRASFEIYKTIWGSWKWAKKQTMAPTIFSKDFKHRKDCEKDAEVNGYVKY